MDKLHDTQLALVICRLFSDTDMMPDSVKKILYTQILGRDEEGNNYNSDKISPDPFLRSMALWLFRDYRGSLKTLLHTSERVKRKVEDHSELEGHNTMPSVFNFYNYLRTHPLLIRERMAKAAPNKKNASVIPGFTRQQTIVSDSSVFVDKVTPMERRLFFKTAHTHYRNGCPLLALEVLSKLPPVIDHEDDEDEEDLVDGDSIKTGKLEEFSDSNKSKNTQDSTDWSQPITNGFSSSNTADAFDWSTPLSNRTQNVSNGLDWSTPCRKFDEEEPKFDLSFSDSENSEEEKIPEKIEEVKRKKLVKLPTIVVDEEGEDEKKVLLDGEVSDRKKSSHKHSVDIFAQQYKFIACLKVLMEEMQTLATGFEVDGGQLRSVELLYM